MKNAQNVTLDAEMLTRLMERYSLDFTERLTLETEEDFFYLSDMEDYTLYYMSMANPGIVREHWNNYKGRKCYEVLQQRSEPCPFCTNSILEKEQYYIWKTHNDIMGRDYFLKDKIVEFEGRPVRMEVVMDVSDPERTNKVLQRSLEGYNFITSCITAILNADTIEEAKPALRKRIAGFYGAQVWFSVYFHNDLSMQTCRFGDCAQNEVFNHKTVAEWERLLKGDRQAMVLDVDKIRESDPEAADCLERSGIRSFCITPVFDGDKLKGIIGIRNMTRNQTELSVMSILAGFMIPSLRKEELQWENQRIQYYDPLTGYRNFEGFRVEMERILAENPDKPYVFWYTDFKKFKYINDVYGYATGDLLLKRWSDYIAAQLAREEIFCRITGDRFAILREYRGDEDLRLEFERAADMIAAADAGQGSFDLKLTCGAYIMRTNADRHDVNEMMDRASMAQRSVKDKAGSHMAVYDNAMRDIILKEMELKHEMRPAIEKEEFLLYLQPQVSLTSGQELRAEVLARWRRKDGTVAGPGEFIPLFEREGLITELDHYMFEHACRYLQNWYRNHKTKLRLSINVSRITMLQPDFVDWYTEMRDSCSLPERCIELEFTESVIVEDYDTFRGIMKRLKEAGFWCAMDDFGAEQSSLNVLYNVPMDVLKLDGMFFRNGSGDERSQAIVDCVIRLARQLEMETVAEGVEDEKLIGILRDAGCTFIQGFCYARPMPSEEYPSFTEKLCG